MSMVGADGEMGAWNMEAAPLTASPVLGRVALREANALLHLDVARLAGQLLHRSCST